MARRRQQLEVLARPGLRRDLLDQHPDATHLAKADETEQARARDEHDARQHIGERDGLEIHPMS